MTHITWLEKLQHDKVFHCLKKVPLYKSFLNYTNASPLALLLCGTSRGQQFVQKTSVYRLQIL